MSTVSSHDLNLKLWNAARDGKNDAVVAAIAAGADVNYYYVSDTVITYNFL